MFNHKAYTLEEARQWFLKHASGHLECHCSGYKQLCSTFNEAEAFYNKHLTMFNPNPPREDDLDCGTNLPLAAGIGLMEGIGSDIPSIPFPASDPTPEPTPFESGGGDVGGAGAGSDWSDSSSSSDAGSSDSDDSSSRDDSSSSSDFGSSDAGDSSGSADSTC